MVSPLTWSGRGARGIALALALAATSCSSGGDNEPAADAAVMASTSIWADVVSNIACGTPVASIVPAGADAHDFELGAKEADQVSRADLLVVNGMGLEGPVASVVDAAAESGVTVIEVAEVVGADGPGHGAGSDSDHAEPDADDHADAADHADDHADAKDHDHDHDEDPHLWLDPEFVIDAVMPIREALGGVEALDLTAEQLDTCAADYTSELTALSEELDAQFAQLTPQERVLVTDHEALGRFADRFGFEVVGTVLPSTSSIGETNARDLDELVATMDEHGVTTVFAGVGNLERLETTLSDAAGEPVTVERLNVESLDPGDGAASYLELMRTNAQRIAQS